MSVTADAKRAPQTAAPEAPGTVVAPAIAATPAISGAASIVHSDASSGPDLLGRSADASFLAEVVLHKHVGTPLCLGVFGPAGSGKSSFLNATLAAVRRLGRAADEAGLATPFCGNIVVAEVTAHAGAVPAVTLLQQCVSALMPAFPRLALDASHAGLDPRAAAREASERLNEARQRLDAERRALDELSGRSARLVESLLFDTAGSRVDAYARANRTRIERNLRRFGLQGEPLVTFKELVRDESEAGGPLSQKTAWLRAFWSYRGQFRLLVIAVVFFAFGWLLGAVLDNQDSLVETVRTSNDKMGPTADWLAAHMHWLEPVRQVLDIAGIVAILTNLVRGVRFLQPVVRAASLLRADIEGRRKDLDSLLAHQHQRVDSLTSEAEAASLQAAETERRLQASATAGLSLPAALPGTASSQATESARTFFSDLAAGIQAAAKARSPGGASAAPSRFIVGLDGLDQLSPAEAAAVLTTARSLLDHPGFVLIAAGDRSHLANGLAETDPASAALQIDRLFQVPYGLGPSEGWTGSRTLVQALLRGSPAHSTTSEDPTPDATHSALDMPWLQSESDVLEALASFAGGTPRAVKRFVNLYKVARSDPRMRGGSAHDLAALAVGLALQVGGFWTAAQDSPARAADDEGEALRRAAGAALGTPVMLQDSPRAMETVQRYGSRA